MADTNITTRRALLKAAPALGLIGALPAAASTDTPIMGRFREWKAHNEWLNSPATDGMSQEEFDARCAQDTDMIDAMCSLPAQNLQDLCLKLIAVTDFGQANVYVGMESAVLVVQEARGMPSQALEGAVA